MTNDGGMIADLLARHAEDIPTWGHLPAAMRLKQAAVARLGPDAAFEACRGHLGVPGLDRMQRLPVRAMHDAARESGSIVGELWPGGVAFERPSMRVLGPERTGMGQLPGIDRSAYLARLDHVGLRGRSALLHWQGQLLMDYEGAEFASLPDNPGYDPGVLHADGRDVWFMDASGPALRIGEAYLLSGNHSVDFGHWITEYLPRLALARLAGLPAGMPVIVDHIVPSTILGALPLLLGADTPVIRLPHLSVASVERLWCASNPIYSGFYPTQWNAATWSSIGSEPSHLATLLRELARMFGPAIDEATGDDRVFLARRPSRSKKKLLNHEAIEAVASSRGFRIAYPEDLPLVEQVRLVRGARRLVAPEGSNALLAWFARPGARVAMLSPTYTLPLLDVNGILRELDVDLTVVTGPDTPTEEEFCPYWNDYTIDAADFGRFLDGWLDAP